MSYPIQRSASEERLLHAAKLRHDEVCTCGPKYALSCPRMAQLILEIARENPVVHKSPSKPS